MQLHELSFFGLVFTAGLITACAEQADAPATAGVPEAARIPIPGAGLSGADVALPGAQVTCLLDVGTGQPAAALEYVLEHEVTGDVVHARVTFHPGFVDNTYGATAVGWDRGHTFRDLIGSDHAELLFRDSTGEVALDAKVDYISEAATTSGFGALGVAGGEGKIVVGDPSFVVRSLTSLDRNLNERGYASFLESSPATDAQYTASPDAPGWDYRVVYDLWVSVDAFGDAGFGDVLMTFVHASPSKAESNTVEVEPGDCPTDGCYAEVCLPSDEACTAELCAGVDDGTDDGADDDTDDDTDGVADPDADRPPHDGPKPPRDAPCDGELCG